MNKYLNQLVDELLAIKKEKDMEYFLEGLFTIKELDEIPKRLQIIKMLKKNIPQHEIAHKLGVGIATVTRGSAEIKKGRFKNI